MNTEDRIYRTLQKQLNRHPVGFPATPGNAEIRLLKHIFTPEQAAVAAHLSHKPEPVDSIFPRVKHFMETPAQLEKLLTAMMKNGGIEMTTVAGTRRYGTAPLVVGIYELQGPRLTLAFLKDFNAYTQDPRFGLSFLATRPPQMRTIPVGKSLNPERRAYPFDDVAQLIDGSTGPFVIFECICRKKQAMEGHVCQVTERKDTCLAMGPLAEQGIVAEMGRQISRKEAFAIIENNQNEGLVLQPSNTQQADFICSCCGCCCGMLRLQKRLPKPVDFWTANYRVVVDAKACRKCGSCADWCQVGAIRAEKKTQIAEVDPARCIGCGLCAANCPVGALTLRQISHISPPKDRDTLHDAIQANRKSPIGRIALAGKLLFDALRTGRTDLFK